MIAPTKRRMKASLVAVLTSTLLLAGCGGFGTPSGYPVQVSFDRTFNLFPGSPVQVLGIRVGLVETLTFDEGDDTILATLRVSHDTVLPADVEAVIITSSLLGERIVQLTPAWDGASDTFTDTDPNRVLEASIPAEFDELLDALNTFVEGIREGDLARLVDNLAEVLDGQGDKIGDTLESVRDMLNVLRDNDEEFIRLAGKLADVNTTLNARRQQLVQVVQDFAELSRMLADQRVPLDQSLSALARLADEAGRLLDTNRDLIERDVATLTRVGRTAERNLDHISALLGHSAELFRHAERILDRERNWLPLVNNTDQLGNYILDTVQRRVVRLCDREGLPTEVCEQLADLLTSIVPSEICLPPLLVCEGSNEGGGLPLPPLPLVDALTDVLEAAPAEIETAGEQEQDLLEGLVGDLLDGLVGDGALLGQLPGLFGGGSGGAGGGADGDGSGS